MGDPLLQQHLKNLAEVTQQVTGGLDPAAVQKTLTVEEIDRLIQQLVLLRSDLAAHPETPAIPVIPVKRQTRPRSGLVQRKGTPVGPQEALVDLQPLKETILAQLGIQEGDGTPGKSDEALVETIRRSQAEQALRESQERLRLVLENSLDVAYRRDLTRDCYDYISPVVEQVLGLSVNEMETLSFTEVIERIHSDDREQLVEALERATQAGKGKLLYRFRNKQGEYRWVADYVTVTKDATGRPVYRTGILRDITEQKQATDLLMRSQRVLVQAEQMAHLGAWEIPFYDLNHLNANPLYWSDEVFRIFGYAPGEVEVTNDLFFSHIPPEEHSRISEAVALAIEKGVPYRIEHHVYRRNGQERVVLEHGEVVFTDTGQPERLIGAVQDITEIKQADQALRESERRFRIALASAPISVFNMDRNLRYTWVYHPAQGVTPGAVLGKRDDELGVFENAKDLMALKSQVIETGQGLQVEIQGLTHGTRTHFLLTLEPLRDRAGQIAGLTGSALDITSLRQMETEQVAYRIKVETQQRLLEHGEQERLQIARDLHDGPMQEILMAIFSLESILYSQDVDDDLAGRLRGVIDTLRAQLAEMRSYAGELRPPALMKFGLDKAIRSSLENWQDKHPDIHVTYDCDQPEDVLPDAWRLPLYRIFQETLNNIAKHAAASKVHVCLEKNVEGETRLTIDDNGQGFETPVDWLALARCGHFGLVGIRERAEALGAAFEVTSSPGQGTRIQISLAHEQAPQSSQ